MMRDHVLLWTEFSSRLFGSRLSNLGTDCLLNAIKMDLIKRHYPLCTLQICHLFRQLTRNKFIKSHRDALSYIDWHLEIALIQVNIRYSK